MTKAEARKKYKALRAQLSASEMEARSLQIANLTLQLPIWTFSFYHLYLTIDRLKEVDTQPLLHVLQGKDKKVVISKTLESTRQMEHYLLQDDTRLQLSPWGIPEPQDGILIAPEKLDVLFVPLLAFDRKGHRIGYGKGFYDRFLQNCRPDALKIGLSFFEVEDALLSTNDTDVSLNYCISSKKIYKF
ncbi:5-formyltetrahydrofolate cyclo-ligase [Croceiramulus getboli]|nr:5-formyltetrahydrofolate cyclo-ligase [Flavobacteriaceae bacterium YJPT1-3]